MADDPRLLCHRMDIAHLSGAYLVACCVLAGAFIMSLVVMAFFLIQAVRPRRFSYLAPETELLAYAKAIEQDFLSSGLDTAAASAAVKREMQDRLLEQMAAATTDKRRVIRGQAQFRGRAIWPLFVSITMIILLFGCVVVGQFRQSSGKVGNELDEKGLRSQEVGCPERQEGQPGERRASDGSLIRLPLLPQDACRYNWLDIR